VIRSNSCFLKKSIEEEEEDKGRKRGWGGVSLLVNTINELHMMSKTPVTLTLTLTQPNALAPTNDILRQKYLHYKRSMSKMTWPP
jgi:hypothetical protein